MSTSGSWPRLGGRREVAIVATVALLYCSWLGAHWLTLPYSSGELPLFASRVWDLREQLARSGRVPWWTPTFLNGSSEALNYAQGLYLVPWSLLTPVFGLQAAGKVTCLLAIFAGAVGMHFCAREVLHSRWAAVAASMVFLFHPLLSTRAAATEHVSVILLLPFVPCAWLFLARTLRRGRPGDVLACATSLVAMLWAQNKQAFVQFLFLALFAVVRVAQSRRRRSQGRALLAVFVLTAGLAAFIVIPAIIELPLVKLFEGDRLDVWQRMYALSLDSLVARRPRDPDYAGIVLVLLAAGAIGWSRPRADSRFVSFVGVSAAVAIALGHGLDSIASSTFRLVAHGRPDAAATAGVVLVVFAGLALCRVWRSFERRWSRSAAIAVVLTFPFVPWFRIVSFLPLYREIRAPDVFFQVPGVFFGALLTGIFVRDVVERRVPRSWTPGIVAVVAGLLIADATPYRAPFTVSDVPIGTVEAARAVYAGLGDEASREPGKAYVVSGRFLHLLGPSWGGPPWTTEAGFSFMAPRGSGLLAAAAGASLGMQRAYLDLVGARWLIFDKTDANAQARPLGQQLAAYRKIFPLDRENGDMAVFRVPHAHPYLYGYGHAALAFGDGPTASLLALRLARDGYALVHADGESLETIAQERLATFDVVYALAPPGADVAESVASQWAPAWGRETPIPPALPRENALSDLEVSRPSGEKVAARFVAAKPCIAVIDESFHPYWRATLDGAPTRIFRVAEGLMGVGVAAGPHDLELSFRVPGAYRAGEWISGAVLLVAVLWPLARGRLRPQDR